MSRNSKQGRDRKVPAPRPQTWVVRHWRFNLEKDLLGELKPKPFRGQCHFTPAAGTVSADGNGRSYEIQFNGSVRRA